MSRLERNQRVLLSPAGRGAVVVEVLWEACAVKADLYVFMLDANLQWHRKEQVLRSNLVSPDGAVVVRAGTQTRQAQVHLGGVDPGIRTLRLVVATPQPNALLESMTGVTLRLLEPHLGVEEVSCEVGDVGVNKGVVLGDLARTPDGWEFHAAWEYLSGGITELGGRLHAG